MANYRADRIDCVGQVVLTHAALPPIVMVTGAVAERPPASVAVTVNVTVVA